MNARYILHKWDTYNVKSTSEMGYYHLYTWYDPKGTLDPDTKYETREEWVLQSSIDSMNELFQMYYGKDVWTPGQKEFIRQLNKSVCGSDVDTSGSEPWEKWEYLGESKLITTTTKTTPAGSVLDINSDKFPKNGIQGNLWYEKQY